MLLVAGAYQAVVTFTEEALFEGHDCSLQCFGSVIVHNVGLRQRGEDGGLVLEVLQEFGLKAVDVLNRNLVELAFFTGPDVHNLVLDLYPRVLSLLEQLYQAGTTF